MENRADFRARASTVRRAGALACASLLAGLAAPAQVACTPGPATPAAPVAQFDGARAWKDLEHLVAIGPRQSGTPGAEAARLYFEQELKAAGLAPVRETFRAETPAGPLEFANVYVDLAPEGAAAGAPWILLCTHYDTKRLPGNFVGANDGGSGTAVLLELARVLARAGGREFGYRILFLDGEEAVNTVWVDPDNRYGSRHHAAQLKATRQAERFRACILLDMVGDKDLLIERESKSNPQLHAAVADAAKELKLDRYVTGRSGQEIIDDHELFMSIGIRSIDLIDFDYGPKNSWWHTLDDKLENCSQQSLDTIGRVVQHALPKIEAMSKH